MNTVADTLDPLAIATQTVTFPDGSKMYWGRIGMGGNSDVRQCDIFIGNLPPTPRPLVIATTDCIGSIGDGFQVYAVQQIPYDNGVMQIAIAAQNAVGKSLPDVQCYCSYMIMVPAPPR